MLYPQPPNQQAGNQEPQRQYGKETIIWAPLPHQISQWPELHHSHGHDGRGKEEDPLPVDIKRILAAGTDTISENIHDFQAFHGEKAQGGVHQKHPETEMASAYNHGKQDHSFRMGP